MAGLAVGLRVLAVAFLGTAALHLVLGLGADALLGAPVSPETAAEPSLDNQNRFYGVTFSLLGVALLVSATDLRRYGPIVTAVLGVLFAAGLARVLSWVLYGAPAAPIVGILVADLLLPPVFYLWLRRTLRRDP